MNYRVLLSHKAEADVDAVLAWHGQHGEVTTAFLWVDGLITKVKSLETLPERCALSEESLDLPFEVRELLYGKGRYRYRILFHVEEGVVHILRIRHSSQNLLTRDDLLP